MEELQQKCPGLAIVPSKLVITRKAGGRGNFIHKEEEEEDSLYAGGGDAVALRTCLIRAVQADWLAASLDIKTAFLNAMLPGEGSDEEVVVILQPPRLLAKLKYVWPDEFWAAVRGYLWPSSISIALGISPRFGDEVDEVAGAGRRDLPGTHGCRSKRVEGDPHYT